MHLGDTVLGDASGFRSKTFYGKKTLNKVGVLKKNACNHL